MTYSPLFSPTFSSFIDFLAINDSGDDISLCDLLDVVVQEVAVEHRHVGNLAELDGSQAVLLMELAGNVDGHGTQRLLAGDSFLEILLSKLQKNNDKILLIKHKILKG